MVPFVCPLALIPTGRSVLLLVRPPMSAFSVFLQTRTPQAAEAVWLKPHPPIQQLYLWAARPQHSPPPEDGTGSVPQPSSPLAPPSRFWTRLSPKPEQSEAFFCLIFLKGVSCLLALYNLVVYKKQKQGLVIKDMGRCSAC